MAGVMNTERERQTKHALTHLTRLAKRVPAQVALLESALRQRLAGVAKVAIEVCQETGEPMGAALASVFRQEGTAELANELHDLLPSETVALRELAVDVTRLALDWQLDRDPTVERTVALMHNYAQRLVAIGDLDRSFEVALRTQKLLAERSPVVDPRLSISLARVLADTGHFDGAVHSLTSALPVLRQRAKDSVADAEDDLAFALHNLGASLGELGRPLEARAALQEAMQIRQRMMRDGSNQHALVLAESLVVAGAVESDLGEHRWALRWTEDAIALLEPLSDRLPDALRQILARALQNQASMYFDLGRFAKSERLAAIAAEFVETLVAERLLAFGPLYVSILRTVANAAMATKRWRPALQAANTAEAVARDLATTQNPILLESLPEALAIKGAALKGLGRIEEAAAAFGECLEFRRTLAKQDPGRFKMDLVRALNNFANGVGWDRRPQQALACAREAVELQQSSPRLAPGSDPVLAATLDTLGCRLAAMLHHRAALRYTVRACLALARPAQRWPDRYADWMHRFIGHVEALRWRVPNGASAGSLRRLRSRLATRSLQSFASGLDRAQHNEIRRLVGRIDLALRARRADGQLAAVRARMRVALTH